MCFDYDESLTDNPFYQEIQKYYMNLIQKVTIESWIFCVPRSGSIHDFNFKVNDIFEHVLVPFPKSQINSYRTLTNTDVKVENKCIQVNKKDTEVKIKILFEETFYINKNDKYTVWCIDSPLNVSKIDNDPIVEVKHCNTLQDCVLFLGRFCNLTNLFKLIEKECHILLRTHKFLETERLQNLRNIIKELFINVLDTILKYVDVEDLKKVPETFDNFKLAVETYIHFVIYKKHFSAVCNSTAQSDSSFNKIVRNNSHLEFKDLGIEMSLNGFISTAKQQLNKINNFHTVLDKVNCIKNAFHFYEYQYSQNTTKALSADDFLNITIFIIIKSNVYNWIANITYITQFLCNNFYSFNEKSFFVTTLEAAIQHIQNESVLLSEKNDLPSNEHLNLLFKNVQSGDTESFKALFTALTTLKESTDRRLCHPLCSCESCENLLNKDTLDINSPDEKGWTLLHLAAYWGRVEIAEHLINHGANVDCLDFMNNSPMHHASSRGHQNVLLLLLHSKSDVNAKELGNGNTPLILASYNGHENCVKALLYSQQKGQIVDVNSRNNSGETALHLASKLGFIEIVGILLQYGADPRLKTNKNLDALELAHNLYIKQIILTIKLNKAPKTTLTKPKLTNNNYDKPIKKTIIQKNYEQLKKVELILKAIENNDTPLMCYHLGIPTTTVEDENNPSKTCCHPLCLCENCQENVETSPEKPQPSVHVNISNSEGYTPLHVATKYGRSETVRLLLDTGASVNATTFKHRYTPLHVACLYQRTSCLRELLQSGACNLNVQDAKGNTPLHCAVFVNNARIAEILLGAGADHGVKNDEGKTPEQEAEKRMLLKMSKLFGEKCHTPNISNSKLKLEQL